ncbi:MAG TPA: hypothetical protein ENJ23_05500, partial [Bacteroidetes bacterium]|nr:hypothetical protein [Bacteroidota bacterium]
MRTDMGKTERTLLVKLLPKFAVVITLTALFLGGMPRANGQRLPAGKYHPIRERQFDILHYRADLTVDIGGKRVSGKAALRLVPLRKLQEIRLDAIRLEARRVTAQSPAAKGNLSFRTGEETLSVELPQPAMPGDTLSLAIEYSCAPNAGMFFQRDPEHPGEWFVFTYGEGGLSANWLPIYSDVNDKFSTEMVITVPRPYTAISNGRLLSIADAPQNMRTFHWLQQKPHSSYLIALYIGDFEYGKLGNVDGVPAGFWVPRGHLEEGRYVFRKPPEMIRFFARRFGYPYPWAKYDQVAVPDYAIGGMEHTTVAGVR